MVIDSRYDCLEKKTATSSQRSCHMRVYAHWMCCDVVMDMLDILDDKDGMDVRMYVGKMDRYMVNGRLVGNWRECWAYLTH